MKIDRILHPTDFSKASLAALDYAKFLARQCGASLAVMHVVGDGPHAMHVPHISMDELRGDMERDARKQIDRYCYEELRDFADVQKVVVKGAPAEEIARFASESGSDIIVMATYAKSGMDYVFGSTTEEVLRRSSCPVLCVKTPAA